jgi:hypothetical protein
MNNLQDCINHDTQVNPNEDPEKTKKPVFRAKQEALFNKKEKHTGLIFILCHNR